MRTAYIQCNLTHQSDKLVALAGVAGDNTAHLGAKRVNWCSRCYMHAMARTICVVALVTFMIKRPKSSGPICPSIKACRNHPSLQTVSLETTLRGHVMESRVQVNHNLHRLPVRSSSQSLRVQNMLRTAMKLSNRPVPLHHDG